MFKIPATCFVDDFPAEAWSAENIQAAMEKMRQACQDGMERKALAEQWNPFRPMYLTGRDKPLVDTGELVDSIRVRARYDVPFIQDRRVFIKTATLEEILADIEELAAQLGLSSYELYESLECDPEAPPTDDDTELECHADNDTVLE